MALFSINVEKLVIEVKTSDPEVLKEILKAVNTNTQKLNQMATKAEVLAIAKEIGDALTNIGDDITRLVDANQDNIPDDVVAEFRSLADRAKAVADRTPEDTESPEEPVEPPVEG